MSEGPTTPESGLTDRDVTQRFAAMFAGPDEETPEAEPEQEVAEDGEQDWDDDDAEAIEDVEQEEDGEAKDDEAPPLHTVRVDGEEVQVSYDELLAGYSRQADYTRKTQALSEERKSLQAEQQQARQEREQYAAIIPQLRQVLEAASLGTEPDWDRLFAEDPVSAAREQYEWRKRKEQIEAVRAEEARIAQQRQMEAQEAQAQHLRAERDKLLSRLPEWKTPEVQQKEQREMWEFARTLGFSDEELAATADHRAVLALRMAMLYERAKNQGKAAKAKAKIQTAAPGNGVNTKGRAKQQKWERARNTGRVADIAPLMGELLSGKK